MLHLMTLDTYFVVVADEIGPKINLQESNFL